MGSWLKEESLKTFAILFNGLVLAFTLTARQVPAQEHRHEPQQSGTKPTEKSSEHGSMHGMHECMQRHQAAMTTVDQVTAMMESAKASDDPVKMKAVIDQAHKQLGELKENMAMCRNMMSMMEKMHGMHGTGGMMKGDKK